jgi:hypothetical protein
MRSPSCSSMCSPGPGAGGGSGGGGAAAAAGGGAPGRWMTR